ncbi:hypothetical protein NQ774_18930 [Ochrobactrum sp. BD61]
MGQTLPSSLSDSLYKVENLRTRPVREWERCIVYTPSNPALFMLDKKQWLLMELADGIPVEDAVGKYAEILGTDGATEEGVFFVHELVGSEAELKDIHLRLQKSDERHIFLGNELARLMENWASPTGAAFHFWLEEVATEIRSEAGALH